MKHKLCAGDKIGKLTLIKRRPMMPGHYAPVWVCRCECGATTEKSRVVLTNPNLVHRCDECFVKSQRAYSNLMALFPEK